MASDRSRIHFQEDFRVRLLWGPRGIRRGVARGDLVVVVDVLSFSTTCVLAAARGARVHPSRRGPEALSLARELGALLARSREEARRLGGVSLSPGSVPDLEPGQRVVLPSPNGSRCAREGREAAELLVGALVNARATAVRAGERMQELSRGLTVVPCGERWGDGEEDGLRVALEDWLGAGAILDALGEVSAGQGVSPEAELARDLFRLRRDTLEETLSGLASGRELADRGFARDVAVAADLDRVDVAVGLDPGDGALVQKF